MKLAFKTQKGTLEGVVREVARMYVILKVKYEHMSESELCELVWQRWLPINRERIWNEAGETHFLRFEEVSDRRAAKDTEDNIFNVFFDILYIETGTNREEKKNHKKAALMLYERLREYDYDYKKELKNELLSARKQRKAVKRKR